MKKFLSVLLVLVFMVSFVGCTKKSSASELLNQSQTDFSETFGYYEKIEIDNEQECDQTNSLNNTASGEQEHGQINSVDNTASGEQEHGQTNSLNNTTSGSQEQCQTNPVDNTSSKQETSSSLCLHKNTNIKNKADATCTTNGNTGDRHCVSCNKLLEKGAVISATGHQTEIRNKKEATSTSEGYTGDTYCKVCNEKISNGEIIPPIDNTEYIELSSAEDVYALSRILAHPLTKTNYFGSGYKYTDDFARFEYPETVDIRKETEKRTYLITSSYRLTSDIELEISTEEGSYFTGISSTYYPLTGNFDGNGKTITLKGSEFGLDGNTIKTVGLFTFARWGTFKNINVNISEDIIVNSANGNIKLGGLFGSCENVTISNCHVTINNSKIGVDYNSDTNRCAYVGGLVGNPQNTIIKDCTVTVNNGSIYAKGPNVDTTSTLGTLSVGGVVGFSNSGSNNAAENIGKIGNQVINCGFISNNTAQTNVILAEVETGDELTVGGIVGCSFNNMIIKNCSVDITKGNIVAKKTNIKGDNYGAGCQVGGIAGRLEHTCETYNCNVEGDYLNIMSQSNGVSTAGGIVGYDWGPLHKNLININMCSFDGNNTSTIKAKNGVASVGGIAGRASYILANNSVKNVTLIIDSNNLTASSLGKCVGQYGDNNSTILANRYFTPDTPEIRNFTSKNIIIDAANSINVGEIYGLSK